VLRAAFDAEYAGIVTAGTRARWVPVLELLSPNNWKNGHGILTILVRLECSPSVRMVRKHKLGPQNL
jgi:hypothetical protein